MGTAWQWSHGGVGVLGMGPGRAVDAVGASQGIWDVQSLAPIAAGGSWRESTHNTIYCTVYFSELNQCVFEVI